MKMMEVYLGNWGTIRCFNKQHREYLIAARAHRDIFQSINSWNGAWLYPIMKQEYSVALAEAKSKCDALWDAIPFKPGYLTKSH